MNDTIELEFLATHSQYTSSIFYYINNNISHKIGSFEVFIRFDSDMHYRIQPSNSASDFIITIKI
jgi:hypothetical protein